LQNITKKLSSLDRSLFSKDNRPNSPSRTLSELLLHKEFETNYSNISPQIPHKESTEIKKIPALNLPQNHKLQRSLLPNKTPNPSPLKLSAPDIPKLNIRNNEPESNEYIISSPIRKRSNPDPNKRRGEEERILKVLMTKPSANRNRTLSRESSQENIPHWRQIELERQHRMTELEKREKEARKEKVRQIQDRQLRFGVDAPQEEEHQHFRDRSRSKSLIAYRRTRKKQLSQPGTLSTTDSLVNTHNPILSDSGSIDKQVIHQSIAFRLSKNKSSGGLKLNINFNDTVVERRKSAKRPNSEKL